MSGPLIALRAQRKATELTQLRLAAAVRLSRQAYNQLETGRSIPSVETALALARFLGTSVEELFTAPGPELRVVRASASDALRAGDRVRLQADPGQSATAFVAGAHEPADGLARGRIGRGRWTVEVIGTDWLRTTLIVGCDPALGALALRSGVARWQNAGTRRALNLYLGGRTQLAGVHSLKAPQLARLSGRRTLRFRLASWPLGFVTRAGNPLGLRSVFDLLRPGVRLVNRERGASARALLDELCAGAGIDPATLAGERPEALGHAAVASTVAVGGADVGITTQAAAAAHGLAFQPLSEEHFELLVPVASAEAPMFRRLLATARSAGFRRDIGALPGYGVSRAGELIGQIG